MMLLIYGITRRRKHLVPVHGDGRMQYYTLCGLLSRNGRVMAEAGEERLRTERGLCRQCLRLREAWRRHLTECPLCGGPAQPDGEVRSFCSKCKGDN